MIVVSLNRRISVTKGHIGILDSAHESRKVDTRQAHACLLARRLVCDGPDQIFLSVDNKLN